MQVKIIRERMELKEKEISGEWLTVERMQKSGEYSKWLYSTHVTYMNNRGMY